MVRLIQPEISHDEVGATVVVEVAHGKAVPPSAHRRQARGLGDVVQSPSIVVVELDGHPLSHRDQAQVTGPVEVDPRGVGDHPAGVCQLGRHVLGHVREVIAVIPEDVTPGGGRICPRAHPPADEQVWPSIAIEVASANDRGAGQHRGKCARRCPYKPATTLVEVEAILQQRRPRRELIATARHVQVRQSISVRVEEECAPVLIGLVGFPRLALRRFDEPAVALLEKELARNTGCTTDEHIVESIAIHVGNGQGRALAGQQVRQEGLHGVILRCDRTVLVLQARSGGHGLKVVRSRRGRRSTRSLLRGICLLDHHHAIDREVGE